METIRHAIVGAGVIGPLHADSIAELPGSQLVVVCDVVADRAAALAGKHGAAVETDFDRLLARPDIDLVHVCTPSGMHADQAVAVLQAGKHVITEKPMDITPAACDRLIAAAAAASTKATCIFQNRFLSLTEKVKEAVDGGLLGRLNMGDAYIKWYRSQEYYDSGDWRATWELDGGGCLMNQGVHYVDLLQWYMGPVESVYAVTATLAHDIVVEDVAAAVLRFRSGAIGVIEGSTAAAPGLDWRIELHGDRGSVTVKNGHLEHWRFLDPALDRQPPQDEVQALKAAGADPASLPAQAHTRQIQLMCEAIRGGGEVPVPVREARQAVEIICAIYESSRTGQQVTLPARS
ncbi:MAG: Gfo/Idh/MocA family oxidoreductase [Fimbriimonadaceae bacterium]|nr:Gfo/Idh/MocA family oxidoreductase [Fimbriimonadaceae bacterium]